MYVKIIRNVIQKIKNQMILMIFVKIQQKIGENCNINSNCYYPINTIYKDKLNKCENKKCRGIKNG